MNQLHRYAFFFCFVVLFFVLTKTGRFNGNHAAKPSVKQAPKSLDLPVK
jgi:hypothetical protein